MSNHSERLYDHLNELWRTNKGNGRPISHHPLIALLGHPPIVSAFEAAGFAMLVSDLPADKIVFASDNCSEVMGHQAQDLLKHPNDYYIQFIEPDDKVRLLHHVRQTHRFRMELEPSYRPTVRYIFTYRLRGMDGVVRRQFVNCYFLDYDDQMNSNLLLRLQSSFPEDGSPFHSQAHMQYKDADGRLHYITVPQYDVEELGITLRELEVLREVAKGRTSQEIAEALGIATATVNKHRQNAMLKMQAENTTQMVALAAKRGLI